MELIQLISFLIGQWCSPSVMIINGRRVDLGLKESNLVFEVVRDGRWRRELVRKGRVKWWLRWPVLEGEAISTIFT